MKNVIPQDYPHVRSESCVRGKQPAVTMPTKLCFFDRENDRHISKRAALTLIVWSDLRVEYPLAIANADDKMWSRLYGSASNNCKREDSTFQE